MRRRDALLLFPPLGLLGARDRHGAAAPPPPQPELGVTLTPRDWRAGQRVHMRIAAPGPDAAALPPRRFQLFIVSGDLEFFRHAHPAPRSDGAFELRTVLPKPGFYRLLGGCFPPGGRPLAALQTIFSPGAGLASFGTPPLAAEPGPARGVNLSARLWTAPATPAAGRKTWLHFELWPAAGLEPRLDARAHLLAASADLIEMLHVTPSSARGEAQLRFETVFPRPGMYRLWPRFRRLGVMNTLRFTVPVIGS